MFVFGFIVGPLIGLLLHDFLVRAGGSPWRALVATALFLIFVLFAPFFALALKLGLIAGTLLGVLLGATPMGHTERAGEQR